ncbi:hypothetical protein [Kitasatospora sp. NPDC001527]|uniref:hypothetical protein n=1 Tax=Kitasatospora sp. NPDC001527 TaxID=3154519 RepID=UPI00333443BE
MTASPGDVEHQAAEDEEHQAVRGHGSAIVGALEEAWEAIREKHPQIRPVVMITGTKRQHGGDRLGHFGAGRWVAPSEPTGRAAELFVAGELIRSGGRAVLAVLLHEGAHALAHARGIRDMSNDRYHSGVFRELAEELGLQAPEAGLSRRHGWAFMVLPDATAERYRATIAALDAAALPYLTGRTGAGDDGTGTGERPPVLPGQQRAGRRFAVRCRCPTPRTLQVTPKSWEDGPVVCGRCWAPFERAVDETAEADEAKETQGEPSANG